MAVALFGMAVGIGLKSAEGWDVSHHIEKWVAQIDAKLGWRVAEHNGS